MPRIFISHSSKDKAIATRLHDDLKRLGHSPWLDAWEIKVGECIVTKVSEGLEAADYVAVLLSPHAVSSGWVEKEWKTKYWDEISSGRVMVLPILIADCDVPPLLKTKRYADCRGDAYASGLALLARDIESAVIAPPAAPKQDAPPLPRTDQRIGVLLRTVQDRSASLSACVADAYTVATELQDPQLAKFCWHELNGLGGIPLEHGDREFFSSYRAVMTYASLTARVNTSYFGWGGNLGSAFAKLADHPDFAPLKILVEQPLSEILADAERSGPRKLTVFNVPARNFGFDVELPADAIVACYARGDAMGDLLERIRTKLTSLLLAKLPMAQGSSK